MAFTSDLQASKLATHYPTTPAFLGDLLKTYWSDPLGGNNGGVPRVGDALYAFYGGTATTLADRANAFWTAYIP